MGLVGDLKIKENIVGYVLTYLGIKKVKIGQVIFYARKIKNTYTNKVDINQHIWINILKIINHFLFSTPLGLKIKHL